MKRIINIKFLAVFFLAIAIIIGSGLYIRHKMVETKIEKLSVWVSAKLIECSELCVLKFEYRQDVAIKASLANLSFLPASHVVIVYDGIIRAGIDDMTKVDFTITKGGKAIAVTIPPVKILGNDLSNWSVVSEGNSWFAPDVLHRDVLNEIAKSQRIVMDSVKNKTDFFYRAEAQIQNVLKETLTKMDFKEITFIQTLQIPGALYTKE